MASTMLFAAFPLLSLAVPRIYLSFSAHKGRRSVKASAGVNEALAWACQDQHSHNA
jgi:hypothetical protein